MGGTQVLAVGERGHEATLANALTSAAYFGLDKEEAAHLMEAMRRRIATRWRTVFAEVGLRKQDLDRLKNSFVEAERADWRAVEPQPS